MTLVATREEIGPDPGIDILECRDSPREFSWKLR